MQAKVKQIIWNLLEISLKYKMPHRAATTSESWVSGNAIEKLRNVAAYMLYDAKKGVKFKIDE